MAGETSTQVFRRAARRVLLAGLVVSTGSVLAGALAGGQALTGAAWGAGACLLLTTATAVCLALPWHRWPALAGAGVMVSLLAKLLLAGLLLAVMSGRRGSFSPGWFFATFAAAVITVTIVEVLTLARGRTLVVEPKNHD